MGDAIELGIKDLCKNDRCYNGMCWIMFICGGGIDDVVAFVKPYGFMDE